MYPCYEDTLMSSLGIQFEAYHQGYDVSESGWNAWREGLTIVQCDQDVLLQNLYGTGFGGAYPVEEFSVLSTNGVCIKEYDKVRFMGGLQTLNTRFLNV